MFLSGSDDVVAPAGERGATTFVDVLSRLSANQRRDRYRARHAQLAATATAGPEGPAEPPVPPVPPGDIESAGDADVVGDGRTADTAWGVMSGEPDIAELFGDAADVDTTEFSAFFDTAELFAFVDTTEFAAFVDTAELPVFVDTTELTGDGETSEPVVGADAAPPPAAPPPAAPPQAAQPPVEEPPGDEAVAEQAPRWETDEWVEPEDFPSIVRPYAWTRGRTRPVQDLALEMLVSTSEEGRNLIELQSVEHSAIAALCMDVRSVAEVAALLGLPLGVARVLLADMIDTGLVYAHYNPMEPGSQPGLPLMERVLCGLHQL